MALVKQRNWISIDFGRASQSQKQEYIVLNAMQYMDEDKIS